MTNLVLSQPFGSQLFKLDAITFNLHSIWFWLALAELLIIIYLAYKVINRKKNQTFSDFTLDNFTKSRNANIDMNNLMDDINQSRDLYKKLSSLCHPDRFVNTAKEYISEEIFQEISKNKRNFEELTRLKERAIKELDIKA